MLRWLPRFLNLNIVEREKSLLLTPNYAAFLSGFSCHNHRVLIGSDDVNTIRSLIVGEAQTEECLAEAGRLDVKEFVFVGVVESCDNPQYDTAQMCIFFHAKGATPGAPSAIPR